MSDIKEAQGALVRRILEGAGTTSPSDRRAAFSLTGLPGARGALIEKVARHADWIDDADIAAVKASGLSEDQIFELVVCAAVGQATRQYQEAVDALKIASCEERT